MSTELLITVQLRFPSLDRHALANHITPMVTAALAAGGTLTTVSVQEIDDEEIDDEDGRL